MCKHPFILENLQLMKIQKYHKDPIHTYLNVQEGRKDEKNDDKYLR